MILFKKLNRWKKKLIEVCSKIFFGLSSPADYAKVLIDIKNPDENKQKM